MKIECQFMELGKPLFLAGTNYGEKLKEMSTKGPLKLYWDSEERRGEVHDGRGFYAYISEAWIFTYEPKQAKKLAVVNKRSDMSVHVPVKAQVGGPNEVRLSAQVSTPMDKVQGKPGKKAKYQGEESQGE